MSKKGKTVYLWNWIWPPNRELILGSITTPLASVKILPGGRDLPFTQEKYRIIFRDLPPDARDPIAGVTMLALEFKDEVETARFASQPPLNSGRIYSDL
jgi:hypothetical protein